MFRIWKKGRLITRKEEKSMYDRDYMSDSGGQRAVEERKTEGERKRWRRDCNCSKRGRS